TLVSGSTLSLNLGGTIANVQHDQLRVAGIVNLNSAKLNVNLAYAAAEGDSFVIVHSTEAIAGTFDGLADLAVFTVGGQTYQIDYTVNTVVLTLLAEPSLAVDIAAASSVPEGDATV